MPLYIEQRIDQLEQHAINDGRLLETVATGLATLTVQVQKNHEQFLQFREETRQQFFEVNQRIDDTNQRIDDTNQRLDKLQAEFYEFRKEVREEFSSLKATMTLMMRFLEEKLK
jgi:vacuolar-type H+-ATPase subunit I/STV1